MQEDFGGLEPRLAALEQMAQEMKAEREESARKAAIQSLKDRYGMRFGNRDDVAMEILNQLNRRGVDVSAASNNAVQDILDDMQGQIAALYDAFNQKQEEFDQVREEAAGLADQLNKIDNVVQAATSGDMAGGEVPGNEPPPETAPEAAPAPEAPVEPAPEAALAPAEPAPAAEAAPAPEAPAPVPPAEPAPMDVPSDARVKNIETKNPPPKMGNNQTHFIDPSSKVNVAVGPEVLSDKNMKNVEAKRPSFGKHLISIASRGF